MPLVTPIKPPNFAPTVEVAACYVLTGSAVLLLEYGPNKLFTGQWCLPAGKLESTETPLQGAHRELHEETGLTNQTLTPINPLYCRKPELDYVFHLFTTTLASPPSIRLSSEHSAYRWVELDRIDSLPHMSGGLEVLHYCQRKYHELD